MLSWLHAMLAIFGFVKPRQVQRTDPPQLPVWDLSKLPTTEELRRPKRKSGPVLMLGRRAIDPFYNKRGCQSLKVVRDRLGL